MGTCGAGETRSQLWAYGEGSVVNADNPQTLTLYGHSITYLQKGAGPVLLLIHGMAGSLETWRSVVDPLARNATVVAVDLPGHGASSPAGGDYSLGSWPPACATC